MTHAAHELKTWPVPFRAIVDGLKKHDIRHCTDRTFAVGDVLHLREFVPSPTEEDPDHGDYTGRSAYVRVTWLTTSGDWGLPDDVCVMSIEIVALSIAPRTPPPPSEMKEDETEC